MKTVKYSGESLELDKFQLYEIILLKSFHSFHDKLDEKRINCNDNLFDTLF